MNKNLSNFKVSPKDSLAHLIRVIDNSGEYACALVYSGKKFINLLTDGDVRRGIVLGFSLDDPISVILDTKKKSDRKDYIYLDYNSPDDLIKKTFINFNLKQLILFKNSEPYALLSREDSFNISNLLHQECSFIIMAGGFGKRLLPLTKNIPKPMLKYKDKPILAHIVDNLQFNRFNNISISTYFESRVIEKYFSNKKYKDISIIKEDQPRGTGGVLSLIKKFNKFNILLNGDILTSFNYINLIDSHKSSKSDLTLVVKNYTVEIPYGVAKINKFSDLLSLEEKPSISSLVNTGIYIFNEDIKKYLPKKKFYTMVDIVNIYLKNNKKVKVLPLHEDWIDIGDYETYKDINEFE